MITQEMKGKARLALKGRWHIEVHHKDGTVDKQDITNAITNVGLNYLLNAAFFDDTAGTETWFIGLVTNTGTFDNTDTMASHAGWTEWTDYDEGIRQAWGQGTASARTMTNASPATFTISTNGTLKGIFVVSDDGDPTPTVGTLWSTAAFTSPIAVVDDDVIKVTYTITG